MCTNYIKIIAKRPTEYADRLVAFTNVEAFSRTSEEYWFFNDADEGSVWAALKAYQTYRQRQMPGVRMSVSVYRPIAIAPEIPPIGATEWKQGRRAA